MRTILTVLAMLLLSPLLVILAIARHSNKTLTRSDDYSRRSRGLAEQPFYPQPRDRFADTNREIAEARERERAGYNALRDDV